MEKSGERGEGWYERPPRLSPNDGVSSPLGLAVATHTHTHTHCEEHTMLLVKLIHKILAER